MHESGHSKAKSGIEVCGFYCAKVGIGAHEECSRAVAGNGGPDQADVVSENGAFGLISLRRFATGEVKLLCGDVIINEESRIGPSDNGNRSGLRSAGCRVDLDCIKGLSGN